MGEAILAKATRPIDEMPISGSPNLVTSGGIYTALENNISPPEVHVGSEAPSGSEVVWFVTKENSNNNNSSINNIVSSKSPNLLVDATIYVGISGNDETGDGSKDAPYATINKALSVIPKNLNGNNAYITFIDNGTYNEVVNVTGFFGGSIIFSGDNYDITINNLSISYSVSVKFNGIHLTANSITITDSAVVFDSGYTITINSTDTGIELKEASTFISKGIINVNSAITAVKVSELSQMYIDTITGGNNEVVDGIIVDSGSSVSIKTTNLVARTLYTYSTGGTISVNAQPTLANY